MNNERRNMLGIAGQWVAIAFMLVGIIWVAASRSGNLDRVVEDVTVVEASGLETVKKLTELEKAVILIQNDMGHMKTDIAEILRMQKKILGVPE